MWALILLREDDEHEEAELIPEVWMKNDKICFYPPDESLKTVNSLAKNQASPEKMTWKELKISRIEKGIDDYSLGMKMLVKFTKNRLANLHSETENRGRGLRRKKLRVESESEQSSDSSTTPSKDMIENITDLSGIPDVASSLHSPNQQNELTPAPTHKRSSGLLRSTNSREGHQVMVSASVAKFGSNAPEKCLVQTKHNCTHHFSDKEALCLLSADVRDLSRAIRQVKATVALIAEAGPGPAIHGLKSVNDETSLLLETLPLKSEAELGRFDKRLQQDSEYALRMTQVLANVIEGKSVSRVTSSCLRKLMTDQLANQYSWKGQKKKMRFMDLRLPNLIVDIVKMKVPSCSRDEIIDSAKCWLAQATNRMIRSASKQQTEESNE